VGPIAHNALLCSVATCSYNQNMNIGIRELKDNLSRYIRRIEAGERIVVTAHGRAVAELVPPAAQGHARTSQFDKLIASGVITPPDEAGDPLQDCPEIRLPPGTAASLIDYDRDEA
ncbi:MAG: type II toxin-antitoxin system prevent-host-death family antitoxin, partial [Acidobacteriota bacterium]|nr:type II toxin-antitoxin system prevent-host-death family antitoxin [Acidobacteriota bacterium]